MEKLKQQNIELTEVCTQTSSSPKREPSSCRGPRKLDDRIKFFEHLNVQRKACKNADVHSQMSGNLLANIEWSNKIVKRSKHLQGQALRSTFKFCDKNNGDSHQRGLGIPTEEEERGDRSDTFVLVHNKVHGVAFEKGNPFIEHDLCKTMEELRDLERGVVNGPGIPSVPNETTTHTEI